jgi:hypothetical protein
VIVITLSDLPNLTDFPQPNSSSPIRLIQALNLVETASTRQESDNAYNAILFALGNNHQGTYCPVVLVVLPLFEKMLQVGSDWTKFTVLEALFDLCCSFCPEVGFEMFKLPMMQESESLEILLKRSVSALTPFINSIALEKSISSESATDLLDLLSGKTQ